MYSRFPHIPVCIPVTCCLYTRTVIYQPHTGISDIYLLYTYLWKLPFLFFYHGQTFSWRYWSCFLDTSADIPSTWSLIHWINVNESEYYANYPCKITWSSAPQQHLPLQSHHSMVHYLPHNISPLLLLLHGTSSPNIISANNVSPCYCDITIKQCRQVVVSPHNVSAMDISLHITVSWYNAPLCNVLPGNISLCNFSFYTVS